MLSSKQKNISWLLFALVLLAQLPFLSTGYGKEFDAWSNALNAKIISETGIYEVSRLPGHPLYELLLSGLWPINHSYGFFNFLSALATAFSVLLVYRIAVRLRFREALLLAIGFAAIPVFFIAGSYTIDYNFAFLFILLGFTQMLSRRSLLAGVFIGIATGFRISSLAFVLPFSLMVWTSWFVIKHIRMWSAAGLTALFAFALPLYRYSWGFFDFHKPPFPSLANIIYKMSFGIWGLPLFLLLAALMVWFVVKRKKPEWRYNRIKWLNFIIATMVIVGMQLFVFLRLPFKSEFFIPALPFVWFALFAFLNKTQVYLVSGFAVLSLVFFGFDYAGSFRGSTPGKYAINFTAGEKELFMDPFQGPLLLDQSKRENKSEFIATVIDSLEGKPAKVWLIAGWYWPELQLKAPPTRHHYDHYSTEREIDSALQAGYSLYYLPEQALENQMVEGHYLADSLGKVLVAP